MTTQLIFTATPKGISASGGFVVSAYVSIRYNQNGTLGQLGLNNWPTVVAGLSPTVTFSSGTWSNTLPGTIVTPAQLGALTPAQLWSALLPSTTPVAAFAFEDKTQMTLHSFGVQTVAQNVRSLYANSALPTTFQTVQTPMLKLASTASVGSQFAKAAAPCTPGGTDTTRLGNLTTMAAMPNVETPLGTHLARAALFYNRGQTSVAVPSPPTNPPPDFHQILAMFGDHPAVLRMLGIVVDVSVPMPAFPAGTGMFGVQVNLGFTPPDGTPPIAPTTMCTYSGGVFAAAPATLPSGINPPFADGQLRLDDNTTYWVETLDVDAAALHSLQYGDVHGTDPTPPNPPALRSTGFTIAHTGREQAMANRLQRSTALSTSFAAGQSAILYADDLVRGWRVDVIRNSGSSTTINSLCRRTGSLTFNGTTVLPLPATDDACEGFVKGGTATTPDPSSPRFCVHEAVFGWDGWSLVAQRPGNTISHDSTATDPTQMQPVTPANNASPSTFPLVGQSNIVAAPGTLPLLRYGQTYQFRARTVDLAGNSVLPLATDTRHLSAPVTYARFEPVPPPAIVLRNPTIEGEHVERLVVRSGSAVVTQSMRHIAPPKTSLRMAETHGMLDPLLTSGPGSSGPVDAGAPLAPAQIDAAYQVALKESGTFLDAQVYDTSQNPSALVPTACCIVTPDPAGGAPTVTPQSPSFVRGSGLSPGQYVHLEHGSHPRLAVLARSDGDGICADRPGVGRRDRALRGRLAGGAANPAVLAKRHDGGGYVPERRGDGHRASRTDPRALVFFDAARGAARAARALERHECGRGDDGGRRGRRRGRRGRRHADGGKRRPGGRAHADAGAVDRLRQRRSAARLGTVCEQPRRPAHGRSDVCDVCRHGRRQRQRHGARRRGGHMDGERRVGGLRHDRHPPRSPHGAERPVHRHQHCLSDGHGRTQLHRGQARAG